MHLHNPLSKKSRAARRERRIQRRHRDIASRINITGDNALGAPYNIRSDGRP
ncbi:hypothetical protein ACPPVT_01430 [Angustibacter sp. McL0619]|uniref:hypothetical protein n=1 Tax=Angustibacter sp. McL0619 TaxID=3415676 RepID=UPI003CFA631B